MLGRRRNFGHQRKLLELTESQYKQAYMFIYVYKSDRSVYEYYALAPYMGSEKLAFETLAEGLCFRIERKKWHITWVGIVEW